jgi:shikimate kinase/3-dehydroquinate synthase
MELVLVGLSGSGKTTIARRLAEAHDAELVDLDETIEREAGRSILEIFESEGEQGFRDREATAVEALGAPGSSAGPLRRVIAAGGGALGRPRSRWRVCRGRRVAWLDAPAGTLAGRLEAHGDRPLLAGRDATSVLGRLGAEREAVYRAGTHIDAEGPVEEVVERVETLLRRPAQPETTLLDAETAIGRLVITDGGATAALGDAVERLAASRVAVVSEPMAWRLHGERLAASLRETGLAVDSLLVPRGERAKTVKAWERLVRDMAARHLERSDPLVAVGGGALGDVAGFAAASYRRGVPLVHVPTTLLAQIDSAIGGKTGLDLPEGKNLVGAFHQPEAIVLDVSLLRTLPARELRAALGEAVKYAALGDDALFALLAREGAEIGGGSRDAYESGALAELVERCALDKVAVVSADELETSPDAAGRISLNLGHSLAHAIEAATGYRGLLHGEAVAHGLRGALEVGRRLGITPVESAARIERLLERLDLGAQLPRVRPEAVLAHLAADKKHAGGRLRWVLLGESGPVVRSDVPDEAVQAGVAAALAGSGGGVAR